MLLIDHDDEPQPGRSDPVSALVSRDQQHSIPTKTRTRRDLVDRNTQRMKL
jgi:hypothetical protein